jgi:hypothetical protein
MAMPRILSSSLLMGKSLHIHAGTSLVSGGSPVSSPTNSKQEMPQNQLGSTTKQIGQQGPSNEHLGVENDARDRLRMEIIETWQSVVVVTCQTW